MQLVRNAALVLSLSLTLALPNSVLAQSQNPHAVSLYNLGLTAYKQGSPESAVIFFKRACDIDPDLADAQYNLGVIYQSERRLKEARPRFEEVLRLKPTDADAHYQLGLVLIDLGQPLDARQHLLCIAPNNAHFAEAQKRLQMIDNQATQPAAMTTAPAQGAPPIVSAPETPAPLPASELNPPVVSTTIQTAVQAPPVSTAPAQIAVQVPVVPVIPVTPPVSATVASPVATPPVVPTVIAAAPHPVATVPNSDVKIVANGFFAPSGLAFDKTGNLYIANFQTNAIERISPDGARTQFSSGTNLKGPIGLILDESGNVYVANYLGGTIARINPAGVSSIIATGFRKPYYLALDHDGNLFVSQQEDNSVVKISMPGRM